jgi:ATP-dependent DNA helicase HFM1/MER3
MKPTERICFREFNKSPFIKSPIKEIIYTYAHKVSLIIQIQLGGMDLPTDKDFNTIRRQYLAEKAIVFDRVQRLVRCVVDCKLYDQDAIAAHNALELARSISAEYWEHSPLQLRQISGIGPVALRKLVQGDIKTITQLASLDTASIERVLSKNPPFGKKILDFVNNFPRLTLNAEIIKILKDSTQVKVQIKVRLGFANANVPYSQHRALSLTFLAEVSSGRLGHHWRGSIRKLEKALDFTFTCQLSDPGDTIICQLACDELVGTVQTTVLKPDIPASAFPLPKLAPRVNVQRLSSEDADFEWDDNEEADFLAALTSAEGGHVVGLGGSYGEDDDFKDIDLFDEEGDILRPEDDPTERPESIQLPNGKWRCNHRCSDGRGTKSGNTCKHRCCRDGIDKPRKAKKGNGGPNAKTTKVRLPMRVKLTKLTVSSQL